MKEFLIFWGVVGPLLGIVVGHRLALGRDRRKEFNTIAEIVYLALEKERIAKSPGVPGPAPDDLLRLQRLLSSRNCRGFRKALATYQESKSEKAQFVTKPEDPLYHDPEALVAGIDGLMKFTKRK